MKKVFWLLISSLFILSCSGDEIASLGLNSASIVNLADEAGAVPAQVVFRGNPTSVTDSSSKETVGVPFHIVIDLTKSTKAMTVANALTSPQITMEVIFIDTQKQSYPFTISPFVKTAPQPGLVPTYTKTTNEVFNLPFAVEKVSRIDFTVDKTVVATSQ